MSSLPTQPQSQAASKRKRQKQKQNKNKTKIEKKTILIILIILIISLIFTIFTITIIITLQGAPSQLSSPPTALGALASACFPSCASAGLSTVTSPLDSYQMFPQLLGLLLKMPYPRSSLWRSCSPGPTPPASTDTSFMVATRFLSLGSQLGVSSSPPCFHPLVPSPPSPLSTTAPAPHASGSPSTCLGNTTATPPPQNSVPQPG